MGAIDRRQSLALLGLAFGAACKRRPAAFPPVPEEVARGQARTRFDSPNPTPAQLARRTRNIARVKALGLPTIDHLPVVEDEASIRPRTRDELVSRCLATAFCAAKGEANDLKLIDEVVARFDAASFFSPEERTFLNDAEPSGPERAKFAWRYECSHVFLWALGYLPALNPPHEIAAVSREMAIIRDQGPAGFSRNAKLRPVRDLLDEADFYYRLDWATTELRLKEKKSDKADGEIVVERHRALNWLIRYRNQDWDDVTTDT